MKQSIRVIIAAVTLWGVACGGNEAEPPVVQAPAPEPEVPEEPAPPPEPDSAPVAVTEATLPVRAEGVLLSYLALPAMAPMARARKSTVKPTAPEKVSFERVLRDAGLDDQSISNLLRKE